VGTLAIEFFVVNGALIANECAPRVHNTGHWTIEGAVVSQFENHIRAITGQPLGDTSTQGYPAMVNVIGQEYCHSQHTPQKGVYVHHYGKQERPGRKLGHITIVSPSAVCRDPLIKQYQELSFVL
jgi:5-(carboxyamino)imidazole ribonucleotide synthase